MWRQVNYFFVRLGHMLMMLLICVHWACCLWYWLAASRDYRCSYPQSPSLDARQNIGNRTVFRASICSTPFPTVLQGDVTLMMLFSHCQQSHAALLSAPAVALGLGNDRMPHCVAAWTPGSGNNIRLCQPSHCTTGEPAYLARCLAKYFAM